MPAPRPERWTFCMSVHRQARGTGMLIFCARTRGSPVIRGGRDDSGGRETCCAGSMCRMRKGRFSRAVGIFIALTASGAAALLWFAVAAGGPALSESPAQGFFFGFWSILYNTDAPAPRITLAAIAMALLLAAGVAAVDRRIANRSRRSLDPLTGPLAPRVVMSATRGVYAGPVKVTVLIPAHNEEVSLPLTIASLL